MAIFLILSVEICPWKVLHLNQGQMHYIFFKCFFLLLNILIHITSTWVKLFQSKKSLKETFWILYPPFRVSIEYCAKTASISMTISISLRWTVNPTFSHHNTEITKFVLFISFFSWYYYQMNSGTKPWWTFDPNSVRQRTSTLRVIRDVNCTAFVSWSGFFRFYCLVFLLTSSSS